MSVRMSTLSTAAFTAIACLAGSGLALAQIADPVSPGQNQIYISKQVVDPSGTPINGIPFVMNINCGAAGPNTSLTLFAPNHLSGVVGVPVNQTCSVVETPPRAPKGCEWGTTYPYGNKVTHGGKVLVVNTLTCKPLTVKKVIVNRTPFPTPPGGFAMQLACSNGQTYNFSLNPAVNPSKSLAIPAGVTCTVTELPPPPPYKFCHWQTSYSPQTGSIGALLTVTNEMVCRRQD